MSIENLDNIVIEIMNKTSELLARIGWTPEEIGRVIKPEYQGEEGE